MSIEEKVADSSSEGIIREALISGVKPGSLIEMAQETIKSGGDDVKVLIYPGVAIFECLRLAAYWGTAYQAGKILAEYLV